jgi:trehalose 6-phosphate synthase
MNAGDMIAALGDTLRNTRLVIVANREPYIHQHQVRAHRGLLGWLLGRQQEQRREITWVRPASGLVTALDPVMRAWGGTWVAHGSGNADREASDDRGRVRVPPDKPAYTLRRVWLSREEEEGYYYGMANNAIWPLCHIAYARPEFNESDWDTYSRVNRRFAETVLEEIAGASAIVFVQDYHFALLPRYIKDARPDAIVCHFWHIPWPNPEAFRVCPWGEQILHGLLGNDLLSFHIQHHCNNFLDTVDFTMEARVDWERFAVARAGHFTRVRPFAISIDPALWSGPSKPQEQQNETAAVRRSLELKDERIIFGVDRLDYTKGIPDRIRAFERMLKRHPDWRERVVFVQVGAPSRDHLSRYKALGEEVDAVVSSVNDTHGSSGWKPVIYLREHRDPGDIGRFYRAADVCVVSSLHDGMNLVAKEFIASRTDCKGVLVLSRFTGAARDLEEAVQVNPFAIDQFGDALHAALSMPEEQQMRRMRALRSRVKGHTVYDWAAGILQSATALVQPV